MKFKTKTELQKKLKQVSHDATLLKCMPPPTGL